MFKKQKQKAVIFAILLSMLISTVSGVDIFATSSTTSDVNGDDKGIKIEVLESTGTPISDEEISKETGTVVLPEFIGNEEEIVGSSETGGSNMNSLGYNDPTGYWISDFGVISKKSDGAKITKDGENYKVNWKFKAPNADAFYYPKGMVPRIVICEDVMMTNYKDFEDNGITAVRMGDAETWRNASEDDKKNAPRESLGAVTNRIDPSKGYKLNGTGQKRKINYNPSAADPKKGSGFDYIWSSAGVKYTLMQFMTVEGTGQKNRNVYRLGTTAALGSNKNDFEQTAKFTLKAEDIKKIRSWCKSYGMKTVTSGTYKGCYKVRLAACVDVGTKSDWVMSGCMLHGMCWAENSDTSGGVNMCASNLRSNHTVGKKYDFGVNNVNRIYQDCDECSVVAYSNYIYIPDVGAAEAEVNLEDRTRDPESTEYNLVLNTYDDKTYAVGAIAYPSDFGTAPAYTGYHFVGDSGGLTVPADGGTMYRYYDPNACTATCINIFRKAGAEVTRTTEATTKTVYAGRAVRGSDWGTNSPAAGYTYAGDTVATCDGVNAITVYRYFDAQSFNVTYHCNFGTTDATTTQKVYVGDKCKLLDVSDTSPWKRTATNGAGYWKNLGWSTTSGASNSKNYDGGSEQTFNATAGSTVHLYAVWQPSLKVEWDMGVRGMEILGSTKNTSGTSTFHTYNTALSGTKISMNGPYHLKDIQINGVSSKTAVENLLQSKPLGNLTDCTTLRIESAQNAQDPKKKVYKHGTTIDVKDCVVSPGDKLDYEIKITNRTSVARDVVITDTLDSGVTYVTGSADNGGTYSNGVVTWNISQIAAGASKTVKFTVEVNDTKQGAEVKNSARTTEKAIASLGETTDLPEVSNAVTNYVMVAPEKHLRKTATSEEYIDNTILVAGDTAYYTISFTNPAKDEKEFEISDNIPDGLEILSVSDGGTVTGQKVTWKGLSVGKEETKVVSAKVKVTDKLKGETFNNIVDVKCVDAYGSTRKSNEVENFAMKEPEKDAYLTLNADYTPNTTMDSIHKKIINDGVLVTYRIKWQNPTSSERKLILKDTIPEYARIATAADLDRATEGFNLSEEFDFTNGGSYLISDNGKYDVATETITWEIDSKKVEAGEDKDSGFVEFTVVILTTAQDLHVTNTASLTVVSPAGLNENNPTVMSNTVDTPILKTPDKIATRADGQDVTELVVSDGEEITYKITFKNPADDAKDFIVTDVVPEFTTLVDGSISDGGTYDSSQNIITWNVNVGANETKTVSFSVLVNEEAQNKTVKNTARVYVDEAKKDTKDSISTDIFILEDPTKAVLNLDGEDINGVVKRVGDIVTYDIVYKNPANTERVATITDKLPAGVEFVTARTQGSYNVETSEFVETSTKASYEYDPATHTVVWTVPTAAGCQEMVSVDVRIKEGAENTILRNTASVYIPDTVKNTNEVYTPVVDNPIKQAVDNKGQNLNGNFVTVGEEFTYTITVENPADDAKVGYITDVLPTGVDFVSADNKGRYNAATHSVMWKDVAIAAHEKLTVKLVVRVNESAKSEIIHNEAVYRIDEAVVSSELYDGGDGGPSSYVTTKYVLNSKGKDIDKAVVAPGNTLVYKISYRNITTAERHFTIYDILPEGLEIVDIGDKGFLVKNPIEGLEGYKVVDGRTVAWQFYVQPGEEGYVTVTAKVVDGSVKEARNYATIMVDGDNGSVPFIKDTNEVLNPIMENPVKMVFNEEGREITDKMVTTGDTITYKITYKNPSDETKYADIKDILPNEVKFVSCDFDGVYDSASHSVKWTNIETEGNARATVSVVVKVKDNAGGKTISNKGAVLMDEAIVTTRAKTLESDPEDPEPSDDPTVDNYVACKKSYDANGNDVTGEIVKVGDTLTYRIKFKNTSSIEKNYIIKDTLPEEVDYVSATGEPEIEGKTLTWSTNAGAGTEGFFDVVVTINEKGYGKKIENVAQITESIPDSFEDPYTVITTTCENYVFDKDDFVKSVMNKKGKDMDGAIAAAGSNLYYHIKLNNPSEKKETFVVTDALPAEVKFVSCTEGGVYAEDTHTVSWELELEADAQVDLEICVKLKNTVESGTVKNIAHVVTKGTEMDSNEVNTYIFANPVKRMKVGNRELKNGEEVVANTSVTFVIEYSNPTDQAREITVTDVLDGNIVDRVLEISEGGKLENGVITWYVEAPANSNGEVSFTIASPELEGVEIKNSALVSYDGEDLKGTTSFETNTVNYIAVLDDPELKGGKDPEKPNIVKTGDDKSFGGLMESIFKVE